MMFIRQTIEIRPNNKQKTYFRQCFGAHRLAYNYGLQEWIRLRDSGQKTNVRQIRATFNAQKSKRWPFLSRLSAAATCFAFDDLKRAFDNFFRDHEKVGSGNNDRLSGFPQPKNKCYNEGSYTEYFGNNGAELTDHRVTAKDVRYKNGIHNTKFRDHPKSPDASPDKPYLRLPRIGTVRMMRPLRYEGRPVSVTIRQHNERFYACFLIEITDEEFLRTHPRYQQTPHLAVGIDLGLKHLAVTSDGLEIDNPKNWSLLQKRDNLLQERMNHCQGKKRDASPSKNFLKAKLRLWRLRTHLKNCRADLRNKLCGAILASYQYIGIETLNVKTMADSMKSKKSKRQIRNFTSDVSLYEIRHRLQTLGELLGRHIVLAPANYPSTRRCCQCGHVGPTVKLTTRIYRCPECGNRIDRDLNAAINLRNLTGMDNTGSMPDTDSPMRSELIKSNIKHGTVKTGRR